MADLTTHDTALAILNTGFTSFFVAFVDAFADASADLLQSLNQQTEWLLDQLSQSGFGNN